MSTAFPILSNAAYINYVGPLQHRGVNASTHLAEIRYPVQRMPIVSVVKLMPPDAVRICNEALAWLFLRGAGVPQARHAAILTLSEKKAVAVLGRKIVYKDMVRDGHVLAWASHQMDAHSLRVLFAGTEGDRKWAKLLCTVQGAAIAAFDETFLNVDRNLGNVLYVNDNSCLPVDNEHIFGGHNWALSPLTPTVASSDTLRRLRNAQQTSQMTLNEYQAACNRMVFHAQKHRFALDSARHEMSQLVASIYPHNAIDLAQRVLSFVTERTASRWMEDRLGVV